MCVANGYGYDTGGLEPGAGGLGPGAGGLGPGAGGLGQGSGGLRPRAEVWGQDQGV